MKPVQVHALILLAALSGIAHADSTSARAESPTSSAERREARTATQPAYRGDNYPGEFVFSTNKTRAQVRAEVREAQRLGLLYPIGDGVYRTATPSQERQIADAGLRARQQQMVAERE